MLLDRCSEASVLEGGKLLESLMPQNEVHIG